jgi:hypothetical protein
MTHTKKSRLLSTGLALAIAPALAFGGTMLLPSVADAAVDKANCRVNSVLASKEEAKPRIPANLQFLKEELERDEFAAYKHFKLLEKKDFKLTLNKASGGKMKSGHEFGFRLLGGDDKRLKLHASLLSKSGKKLLNTDYTIDDNGILIVAGGKHADGKIIFAIQCKKT